MAYARRKTATKAVPEAEVVPANIFIELTPEELGATVQYLSNLRVYSGKNEKLEQLTEMYKSYL